jgi:hypothetical protein
MSDGLIEAMWETLAALTVAAAICIGITSLSACLNEVRTARASVATAHADDAAATRRAAAFASPLKLNSMVTCKSTSAFDPEVSS